MEGVEGHQSEYAVVGGPEGADSTETSSEEFRFKRIPYKTPAEVTDLRVGQFVDHRDVIGKFVAAEVIDRKGEAVKLHYLKWPSKWDRWVNVNDPHVHKDFAVFQSIVKEKPPINGLPFSVGDYIEARPMYYRKDVNTNWAFCEIKRIDKMQMQVCIDIPHYKSRLYWLYAADIDEVKLMDSGLPPAKSEPGDVDKDDDFMEDDTVPNDPANTHAIDDVIEVRDKAGIWHVATVIKKKASLIRVNFMEMPSSVWDETLDVRAHKDRIRALGSGLEESAIEEKNRVEMERFVGQIKANHWEMREVDPDGNCLFRAIADQIYDDVKRHREVRDDCCDYMVENRSFFAGFEPEFDAYIAKKRDKTNPSWGDHVDIMAICEMYNLKIHVLEVDNLVSPHLVYGFVDDAVDLPLVRVSRHRQTHYNSVRDPKCTYPLPIANRKKGDVLYVRDKRVADDEKAAADIKSIKDKSEAAEAEAKSSQVDEDVGGGAAAPAPSLSLSSSSSSSKQRRPHGPQGGAGGGLGGSAPPRGSHQQSAVGDQRGGPPGLSQQGGGGRRPNVPPDHSGGGQASMSCHTSYATEPPVKSPSKKALEEKREQEIREVQAMLADRRISKEMLKRLWQKKTTRKELLEKEVHAVAFEVLKMTRDELQKFWDRHLKEFDDIMFHGTFEAIHKAAIEEMIKHMREKQRKRIKGSGDFSFELFCKGVYRHLLPVIENALASLIVEQRSQLQLSGGGSGASASSSAGAASSAPSAPSAPLQLDRKPSGGSGGIIGRWKGRSGPSR